MARLTDDNIDHIGWLRWITKDTGQLGAKPCCSCGKTGSEQLLSEMDAHDGLAVNVYCKECGNKRLEEYISFYKGLMRE